MRRMRSGILLVDKPRGMTSHDVVAAVRRIAGMRAVGHTGTLDPEASGVLVLCLGRATKFARFFEHLDKVYWTVLQLGACTDTQDATGVIVQEYEVPEFSCQQVQHILSQFTGPLKQIPPMYSAVKHHGQRLYRLARQGQTVVRQARDILIERLDLLEVRGKQVTLSVACSKGTYIRTLGEDIGLALDCGAYVQHLQRCRVGPFALREAYSLDDIRQQVQEEGIEVCLMPLAKALEFLPALPLTAQQYGALRMRQGQAISAILHDMSPAQLTASCYRLCHPSNDTVAVIQRQAAPAEKWKLHALIPLMS